MGKTEETLVTPTVAKTPINLTEADYALGEAQASTVAPTEKASNFEFIELDYEPMTPEAFAASRTDAEKNGGRYPVAMFLIRRRAKYLGHSLTLAEYREIVKETLIPDGYEQCSYAVGECPAHTMHFQTALVLRDGTFGINRRTGLKIWRAGFLRVKVDGKLVVRPYCSGHVGPARDDNEMEHGYRPEPQTYDDATADLQGILDHFRSQREAAAREAEELSIKNRNSLAGRGRFSSAPRNPGDLGTRHSRR